MFAALLWSRADRVGLAAYALLVSTTIPLVYSCVPLDSTTISPDRWIRRYTLANLVSGAVWGSLPLLAMPGNEAWQAFVGIMVFGVMASTIVFSSTFAQSSMAFNLMFVATVLTGFGLHAVGAGRWVIPIVIYALPFSMILGYLSRLAAERGAMLTIRSRRLAEDVVDEQARLKQANERLAHQASHDSLTGLANRHTFSRHLEELIGAARIKGRDVGVLFVDLDRFKVINDSLGHTAGDELLQVVARRMSRKLPAGALLARVGGDEMTVALPLAESIAEHRRWADELLAVFDEPMSLAGKEYKVTASIGLALAEDDDQPADVLRHADAALYQAKANGRARVEVFDASMRTALLQRADNEQELRDALLAGSIVPYYQPIVDLQTGCIQSAEALARWPTELGVMDAGRFMPAAEEAGLDRDISLSIVAAVDETILAAARADGVRRQVSVNVPAGRLHESLHQLVDEVQLRSDLTLEITETDVIRDIDSAIDALHRLRELGCRIWLDDFGTGHSSMALVSRLPIDGLKLDRSFVMGLPDDRAARAIVAATVELTRGLGIQLVAEGVETIDQAETLRDLGVVSGQGFLFSKAVPWADVEPWFTTGASLFHPEPIDQSR